MIFLLHCNDDCFDNYFYSTFIRELEKFYDKAMNLVWQQIDATEMLTVAEQAKKADKRQ